MKNAVPKNDKKKRKQLTEEIAKLEADLNQKHEEEFRQLQSTTDTKVNENSIVRDMAVFKMYAILNAVGVSFSCLDPFTQIIATCFSTTFCPLYLARWTRC